MAIKQILIVDDEERIREVVRMCLVKLGKWEAITAASGQEAIQIAATLKPDAILLDLSMPEMDGLETLRQLQNHPQTAAIPVIFLTAKAQDPDTDRSTYQQLGVAGLIVKPFNPVEISLEIRKILGWDQAIS